jgi:osmotically-inducible protein OsmY
VTLAGFIDTYAGKLAAERSVKGLRGVRAVANDLVVRLKVARSDADIAADAALKPAVPASVQAVVHNGRVTVTGKVDWLLQKEQAAAVRDLAGVVAVFNHIDVAPRATERDLRHRIVEALHRNADVDARHIEVSVHEGAVRCSGDRSRRA